jgi:flagellum-specific peptidoglycan hydrolase FlgJ
MANNTVYINDLYKAAAKVVGDSGIYPETIVTQKILESGYTDSKLATIANNYFGIKSSLNWKGKVISMSTNEFFNGVMKRYPGTNKIYENRILALKDGANAYTLFRWYPNKEAGIKGYVELITGNPRYKKAGVLDAKSIPDQFAALVRAGYATDPQYLDKLVLIYTNIKRFFF